jgi:hypothetical protein
LSELCLTRYAQNINPQAAVNELGFNKTAKWIHRRLKFRHGIRFFGEVKDDRFKSRRYR